MSEENVEIVRRGLQAWNRDDLSMKTTHPDIVVIPPEGWPEGSELRGRDAWKRQAQRLRDSWEDARIEVDELRAAGADRVFARFRYVTRGKDSGIPFETPMAAVYTVTESKVVRAEFFWEPAGALEAAGLSE